MAEKKGGALREIVAERIGILLSLSQSMLRKGDEKRAKRYVYLARKLSTRYNCRFSPRQRLLFCKSCGMPSVPGKNTTVRLRKRQRAAEYLCPCGAARKISYNKKQA